MGLVNLDLRFNDSNLKYGQKVNHIYMDSIENVDLGIELCPGFWHDENANTGGCCKVDSLKSDQEGAQGCAMYSTSSVSCVTAFSLICICLNLVSSSHLISPSALTSET